MAALLVLVGFVLIYPYVGIGNYLRAEVCYRAGVSPFTPASDIFSSFSAEAAQYSFDEIQSSPSPASFSKAKMIMYLCRAIPLEVLEKGLNKYGNDQEQQVFHDWLRVYDKGEEKEVCLHLAVLLIANFVYLSFISS